MAAAPALVAGQLADPAARALLWPDLALSVAQDRGVQGQRYTVTGAWQGSAELWLERCADGVLVHAYLRINPAGGPLPVRRARAELDRRRRRTRWGLWMLKDVLEDGRAAGETPVTGGPVRGSTSGRAR